MSSSLYFQPSTISPDGRFAAYFDAYGQSQPTLRVMDLSTGRTRNLLIGGNDSFGGDPVAWAPGGHLMLVVDDAQMIQVLDPATGKRHVLDARIPQASQLAVRPAP
jgi:hypothetical protein